MVLMSDGAVSEGTEWIKDEIEGFEGGTAAMAKRLVILNAKRERIRNTLRGKTDCRAPCGARNDERWKGGLPQPFTHLVCRLGRCFCFTEVSTGHPHRNDK